MKIEKIEGFTTLLVQTFAGRKFRIFAFFSYFCENKFPRNTSIEIRESLFHAKFEKNEIRKWGKSCSNEFIYFICLFIFSNLDYNYFM